MKKFIIVLLVLAVCGIAIYFGYPEINKLISKEQEVTSSQVNSTSNVSSAEVSSDISNADNSSEAQTSYTSSNGGNSGNAEKFAMALTISEDKYFIDNREIGFEELKAKIDGLEADAVVAINDENSSLKAFNAIKDYLNEKGIAYSIE